jgi:hypothetical protein
MAKDWRSGDVRRGRKREKGERGGESKMEKERTREKREDGEQSKGRKCENGKD